MYHAGNKRMPQKPTMPAIYTHILPKKNTAVNNIRKPKYRIVLARPALISLYMGKNHRTAEQTYHTLNDYIGIAGYSVFSKIPRQK